MNTVESIIAVTAAAAAIALTLAALGWGASRLLDRWLDRRLVVQWGEDEAEGLPIYEQTVRALRYRPGVGS